MFRGTGRQVDYNSLPHGAWFWFWNWLDLSHEAKKYCSVGCHQEYFKKGIHLSYSSYRPGAIHPVLHIILVLLILFFKSFMCKIASAARN